MKNSSDSLAQHFNLYLTLVKNWKQYGLFFLEDILYYISISLPAFTKYGF